jgi:hypothetical protein
MEILKVGLVMVAGLGSTWVARETTDLFLAAPAGQGQGRAQEPAQDAAAEPAPGGAPAAAIPEMSREEMEEELKRAQAELAGGGKKDAELREFRPTRPLPADLPIALPSDI